MFRLAKALDLVTCRPWFGALVFSLGTLHLGCNSDDPAVADQPGEGGAGGARADCESDSECDDGIFCNGQEVCREGFCRRTPGLDCNDGIACTVDYCDEALEACQNQAPDEDGDGSYDAACTDEDGDPLGTDCDDQDPLRYPGAYEICDPEQRDEDCDPKTIGDTDRDGDGYVDAQCCNEQHDGELLCGDDCDDFKPTVHPEATEECDYLDNDCNGETDEGVSFEVYPDKDHDGRGDDKAELISACPNAVGVATVAGDCNDEDPEVFTGQFEICDGKDNNCSGEIDEIEEQAPWYVDADGDTYGDPESAVVYSCYPIKGRVLSHNDCDDENATINRNAPEICDGLDNNCNGLPDFRVGTNDFEDDDRDGVADEACGGADCQDRDPRTAGGADEVCDHVDNDCDGDIDEQTVKDIWYLDEDGDGWGVVQGNALASCYPLPNRTTRFGDCDDASTAIFPGTVELCDGVDNDCDGLIDEQTSSYCQQENAISTCQEGRCQIASCLSGYVLEEASGERVCVPASDAEPAPTCEVDADCNDGDICNGVETCVRGTCRKGPPPDCETPTTVFGDVFVQNTSDIHSLFGIRTITGTLTIQSPSLTSLVGLESLRTIGKDLLIENNSVLTRLSGSALSELETVGGSIVIGSNPELFDVNLPSLVSAHSLLIENNPQLSQLSGYNQLVQVTYRVAVRNNPNLQAISGFGALQYLGGAHTELDPLTGGCASATGGGLRLSENTQLASLSAFESLERIGGDLCVSDYEGADLYFPSLRELNLYGRITAGAGLDFPVLESIGRGFAYFDDQPQQQDENENAPPPIALSFPKLTSTLGFDLLAQNASIEKLDLRKLAQATDVSIDLAAAGVTFEALELENLLEATSLYVDIQGDDLTRVSAPSWTNAPGFLYVRAVGPQMATVDLSSLASAASLQIYVEGSGQPVTLRLDALSSPPQAQAELALCTGTLLSDDPPTYGGAACTLAQALLDAGYDAAIDAITCGQCLPEVRTCPGICNDQNDCTTDACVEGRCVFSALDEGTDCTSGGVCSAGEVPQCVTCIDDQADDTEVDTGCSAGAPQCVAGQVPTCAGCTEDDECESNSPCREATCDAGFCSLTNVEQKTPCTGSAGSGVCDEGACVPCIDSADCEGAFCESNICVECLSDQHCPGGVCNGGSCVECVNPSDCDDQNPCTSDTCSSNSCVHTPLNPATPCTNGVCSAGPTPQCVRCIDDENDDTLTDSGCGDTAPLCIMQDDGPSCAGCATNDQCENAGECTAAVCAQGVCEVEVRPQGAQCNGGLGVCDTGTCVECIDNQDCEGGYCDQGSCVQCLSDNHCDGGVCDGGSCVECLNSSQCNDGNACTTDTCNAQSCTYNPRVAGATCSGGICNGSPTAPSCVQCVDDKTTDQQIDMGCTAEVPLCDDSGTPMCVGCESDDQCDVPSECTAASCEEGACVVTNLDQGSSCGRSGVCDEGSCVDCIDDDGCGGFFCQAGSCVQCLGDQHCDGGVCNAGVCVQCVTAGQCDDGNDCTTQTCSQNQCSYDGVAPGTACEGGEGVCAADSSCVPCLDATHCDDNVACTEDVCSADGCTHTPNDQLCPDTDNACTVNQCNAFSGCQVVNIGTRTVVMGPQNLDGSFELGDETSWSGTGRLPQGQKSFFLTGADSAGGSTTPTDGKFLAWLQALPGASAAIGQTFRIPRDTTTLDVVADISLQTVFADGTNDFVVELTLGSQKPVVLASFTSKDAQVEGTQWRDNGIKATNIDAIEFGGTTGSLIFRATGNGQATTDLLIDNVRIEALVCGGGVDQEQASRF